MWEEKQYFFYCIKKNAIKITGGYYNAGLITASGKAIAWGKNSYGVLGNGTTTDSNKPVQVKIDENTYLTNVRKISTSNLFTVALTTNGEAYAWGYNPKGQLGQGTTSNVLMQQK